MESEEGRGSTFTVTLSLSLFRGGAAKGNGHVLQQAESDQSFVRI